ncbi:PIN domain-containing protein [Streptomyces sp. NPDC058891]|uniref:PIN domain-containing protein n=1 Tax=Streptomyces sp. NPDC058891 TaxID=3346667 RepID=UPI0036767121
MIIFDTNALNLLPPDSPRADLIRKLRQSGHHRVAVPWMVLEELVAHQAKLYPVKHQAALNTLERLREVLPWDLESVLEPLDLERFLNHWRGVYGEIFEVIETSGDAARMALSREAIALPPAKRAKDRSEGARDAAIWFSILEFLKANPDEHVHFVTNNTADFGDGTAYPYPMDDDLRGLEDRLTRLADFDAVVVEFTKEVSGADIQVAAEELLRSNAVRQRVAQTAVGALESATGFEGLDASDAAVAWSSWLSAPEVELLAIKEVTGHEIEGDVWYTANVRWLLYGGALSSDDGGALSIACVWDMKVLFSTSEEGDSPTVLSGAAPSLPDTADQRCMGLVRHFRESAARLASRVAGNVVGTRDVWTATVKSSNATARLLASLPEVDTGVLGLQQGLAKQLAESQPKLDLAGLMPLTTETQRILASLPKIDTGVLGLQRVARQLAESQPKLDLAGLMPLTTETQRILVSLPKIDYSPLLNLQRDIAGQVSEVGRPSAPAGAASSGPAAPIAESDGNEPSAAEDDSD